MTIHWAPEAIDDVLQALAFIADDSPNASERTLDRIAASVERLQDFPALGRAGRRKGTRELVIPGLPFVVVYRVIDRKVFIVRVYHTSLDWTNL